MKLKTRRMLIATAVIALAALTAFALVRGRDAGEPPARSGAAAGRSGSAGPAVSVSTVVARARDVPVELAATGTVTALNSVEVRPQVGSVISKVHIREGQAVKAGELLFTLDARSAQASLNQARAQLRKDEAALADARRQLARSQDLLAQGFVSQGAVDTNQAQVDALAATLEADRSALQAAQVSLGYTRITAPTAGRTGAISVVAGSTVQANTTPLVTITQLQPIAVAFNVPQRHLNDALQLLRQGGGSVTARLPDGGQALTGRLQFVDNVVDAASGTVKVKAQFDNAGEALWPGAFVDVNLTVRTLQGAVLIPQAAIILGERGRTAYVVDPQGKAALRPVEVVHVTGPDAVVKGIQDGERVVVEGRQNLRPGVVVVDRRDPAAAGSAPRASES